jgi:hypothetical protein
MRACAHPLDLGTLADYWIAALTPDAESAVEAHLLGCSDCSRELERVAALATAIRDVVRQGRVRFVLSPEFCDRLAAEGLHVRAYSPPAGGSVQCSVYPEDDLLVAKLSASLAGAARIDLLQCDAEGVEFARLRDIPFDPRAAEIVVNEPIEPVRHIPSNRLKMRLVSVEPGVERVLAEYTFDHVATP